MANHCRCSPCGSPLVASGSTSRWLSSCWRKKFTLGGQAITGTPQRNSYLMVSCYLDKIMCTYLYFRLVVK